MSLRETCRMFGDRLPPLTHENVSVDGARVLWAIAAVESSYGAVREYARIEPAYQPGGSMYRGSEAVRALWHRYGALAACSWGTWQMMATTAVELGHRGHPWELQSDDVLAPLVAAYLWRAKVATLRDALDAYNSGSCRDRIIPAAYIRDGIAAYLTGWDGGPQ